MGAAVRCRFWIEEFNGPSKMRMEEVLSPSMRLDIVRRFPTFYAMVTDVENVWFQHDDATSTTSDETIQLLLGTFVVPCLQKHLDTGKWTFNITFCIRIPRSSHCTDRAVSVLNSKRKHVRSYSLYSKHLTRTQFCTRTNITHIVIPLNLCKYTLFSKSEDYLFLQPVHLRAQSSHNAYGISERDNISSRENCPVIVTKI